MNLLCLGYHFFYCTFGFEAGFFFFFEQELQFNLFKKKNVFCLTASLKKYMFVVGVKYFLFRYNEYKQMSEC